MAGIKSCDRILFNNLFRDFKKFADNVQGPDHERLQKLHTMLNTHLHGMSLCYEDEDPDPSLVTQELVFDCIYNSIDLISALLKANSKLFNRISGSNLPSDQGSRQDEPSLGVSLVEMKQMQTLAKQERQSCHTIIVDIEKLMYEMNNLLKDGF